MKKVFSLLLVLLSLVVVQVNAHVSTTYFNKDVNKSESTNSNVKKSGFTKVVISKPEIKNICDITTFPFLETFEDDSQTRDSWTQIQENGTKVWTFAAGSGGGAVTTAHSGTKNARFVSDSNKGAKTKLVSPTLDISGLTNPEVSFWYAQEFWSPDQNQLKVYYSDDAGTTWVEIAYYTNNISTWTKVTLALPNQSATYQIAFEGINNQGRANVLDDIIVRSRPTCIAPAQLMIYNVTSSSVTFNWTTAVTPATGGYEIYYSTNSTPPINSTTPTATVAQGYLTYNIPTLPTTTYYAWVRSNCGGGDLSEWSDIISFTTPCEALTLPFSEGFNTSGTSVFPNCWRQEQVTGSTMRNITFTSSGATPTVSSPKEGSRMIYWNSASFTSGDQTRLVSIPISINAVSSIDIEFWWYHSTNSSANDGVQVQYSINNGTTWINAGSFIPRQNSTAGWTKKELSINGLNNSELLIGFLFKSGKVANCYLDDLKIYKTPTCRIPTALTLISKTSTSANISWTASVSEPSNGYQIYCSTSPTPPTSESTPNASVGADITTGEITNLTPGTTYYVWVRSNCGGGDLSEWSESSISFTTRCSAVSLPIMEGFNTSGNNIFPDCWEQQYVTGTSNIQFDVSGYTVQTTEGSRMVYWNSGSISSGNQTRLISTPISINGISSIDLEFMWYNSAGTLTTTEGVQVQYSLDNGITWTNTGSFIQRYNTTVGWVKKELVIDELNSSEIIIGLLFRSDYKSNCYLDELIVKQSPTCRPPTLPTFVSRTANSANISWTASVSNPSDGYQIYCSSSATAPTSETTPTVSVGADITVCDIPSLSQNTIYYAWIRSNCGNGDLSEWSSSVKFMTAQVPANVSYSCNFENSTENTNWTLLNENQTNKWFIGAVAGVNNGSGSKGLFISNNDGVANNYDITQTSYSYAYRTLSFNSIGWYTLDFDWKSNGRTNYDIVRAFLVPDNIVLSAGNAYGMTTNTNTIPSNWIELSPVLSGKTTWQTVHKEIQVDGITIPTGNYNLVFFWKNYNTSGTQTPAAIDNISFSYIACTKPSGVIASNIAHNSAKIDWTKGFTENEWNIIVSTTPIDDFTGAVPTENITNVTSYLATNLQPTTTYYVYVQAVCPPSDESEWTSAISFTTLIKPADLPYSQNFSNTVENNDWLFGNGSQINRWYIGSTTSGTNSVTDGLYVSNDNGTSNTYGGIIASYVYAYRSINFSTADHYSINFDYRVNGEVDKDLLRVFLVPINVNTLTAGNANGMTDVINTNPAGWIALDGGNLEQQSTFQSKYSEFSITTAGVYNLVFFWKNNGNIFNNPPAAVDNILIKSISCPMPTFVTIPEITTTDISAKIDWAKGSNETEWNIIVSETPVTDFEAANIHHVAGPYATYNALSLNATTTYYVYVQAICGLGNESLWTEATTFKTSVTPSTIPYTCYFNNTIENSSWSLENGSQTNKWFIGSTTTGTYPVTEGLYITNTTNGSTNDYTLTSTSYVYAYRPIKIESTGTYYIDFDWKSNGENNNDIVRAFLVPRDIILSAGNAFDMTGNNNNVPNNWIALSDVLNGQNSWQTINNTFEINGTTNQTGVYNLVFFWKNNASVGNKPPAAIDNIRISKQACEIPTGVLVSSITDNSANISWNSDVIEEWNIIVSTTPIADFESAIKHNVRNSSGYSATNLVQNTTYYIYVQTVCSTNNESLWTTALTFKTLITPASIPYECEFNNSTENNYWTLENGSQTNKWFIGNATVTNPISEGLYISNATNGTSNLYTVTSTSYVYAYRPIKIENVGTYYIDFDWKSVGEANNDIVRAFLVPNNISLTAGNAYGMTTNLNTVPNSWIELSNTLNGNSDWQTISNTFQINGTTSPVGIYNLVFFWKNNNSVGSQPPAAIDNIRIAEFECMRPTAVTVSSITNSSATISWTKGATEEEWNIIVSTTPIVDFSSAILNNVTGTNPTYSASPLIPNTKYYVYVQAICGVSNESLWTSEVTFKTPCLTYSLPFSENFNELTSGIPTCWDNSIGTTTNDAFKWNYYATGYTGSCVRFNSYNNLNGIVNFLQTPIIDLNTATNPVLKFMYKNQNGGDFSVFISTDGGATYGTSLATGLINQSSWISKTIDLTSYVGNSNVVIVFKGTSNFGDSNSFIYIDDIEVREAHINNDIISFSIPEQLSAATIDQVTHTVSLEVPYSTNLNGLIPTITVSEFSSINPVSGIAQDFTSPVTYTVTAESGAQQAWIVTVTNSLVANTGNDILTFTLPQQTGAANINTVTKTVEIEVSWQTASLANLTPTITISELATINPASGLAQDFTNPVVYTVTAEDETEQEWTVSVTKQVNPHGFNCADPIIVNFASDLPYNVSDQSNCGYGNTYAATCLENYNGEDVVYRLDVIESALVTITMTTTSTNTGIALLDGCPDTGNCLNQHTTGTTHSIEQVLHAGTYYLIIDSRSTTTCIPSYSLTINADADACVPVSNILITNILQTSARVSWTEGLNEDEWNIKYGVQGFNVNTGGTLFEGITNPYNITTGLVANTSYDVYVQSHCDASTSTWSGPINFRTLATCPTPTNIVVSNIHPLSAHITWNGYTAEEWDIIISETFLLDPNSSTNIITGITTESYDALALSGNTTYYVYLRANCNDEESNWSFAVEFTTPQATATIPYECQFNNSAENVLWTILNGNQTNKWHIGSTTSGADVVSEGLYISNNGGASNNYSITNTSYVYAFRTIDFETTGVYNFKLDWRSFGENNNDLLHVFLIPNDITLVAGNAYGMTGSSNTTPTDWIAIGNTLNLHGSWQNLSEDILIDNIGEYNLVFFWKNNNILGTTPPAAIDNIYVSKISCPRPTNLISENVTHNSALVKWIKGFDEIEWTYVLSETSLTQTELENTASVTALDTFVNISTLNELTTYYFYVKAVCGTDDESLWSNILTFTTTQSPANLPYTCNFNENDSENNRWTLENGTQANKWYIGSTTAATNSVSNGLYISNDNGETNAYIGGTASAIYARRPINIENIGLYDINFSWRANGELNGTTYNDYLRVFLVPINVTLTAGSNNGITATGVPEGWISLDGESCLYGKTTWQNEYNRVNIPVVGEYNLVYYWRNNNNTQNQPPAAIDNISLSYISCPEPTAVMATQITQTSATISWTKGYLEEEWDIIVSETPVTDFESAIMETVTTIPSHPLNGLNIATSYYVYVRSVCSPTDNSIWTRLFTFKTLAIPTNLPYTHNFGNATENNNWTLSNNNQTNQWHIGTTTGVNSVTDALYISNNNGVNNEYTAIDATSYVYAYRPINFSQEGSYLFSLDWRANGENNFDLLRVFLVPEDVTTLIGGNSNGMNGSINVVPANWISITSNTLMEQQTSWQYIRNIEIPISNTGTYNLVFFWKNDDRNGNNPPAAINNINVSYLSCRVPTAVVVNNITTSSADISWTMGANSENEWNIIISPTPITDFTSVTPTDNITNNPEYLATDLSSATLYYVYVQAVCGAGDESIWTQATTFRTLITPASMPYNCNFSNTIENNNWVLLNGSQTNKWYIGNTTTVTPSVTEGLYISNNNGTSNIYGNTTSYTYAYRLLNIENAGFYDVNFDWRANGENNNDYLRAFLVPSNITITENSDNSIAATGTPAGWINIDGGNSLYNKTAWQNEYREVNIPSAGEYNLVFYWKNNNTVLNQPPAAIDNISISYVTCRNPLSVTISGITNTSASISWTPGDTHSEWNVKVSTTPIDPSTDNGDTYDNSTTNNPLILTTLASVTTYYVYVQTVCESETSNWSAQQSFITYCDAQNLTINEGFNTTGDDVSPDCWSQQYVNGTRNIQFVTSGTFPGASPYEGSRMVYFNSGSASSIGDKTRLVSCPVSSLGIQDIDVKFAWYQSVGTQTLTEGVQVQYSFDGQSWTNAGSFIQRYATTNEWVEKSIALPIEAGNQDNLFVGFLFTANGGFNMFMDAIVIKPTTTIAEIDVNNDVSNISVCVGTAQSVAISNLASQITIKDSDNVNHIVNVSWTIEEYNSTAPGTYNAIGTFELPNGIIQPNPIMDLEVLATVTVNPTPTIACPDDMSVQIGTITPFAGYSPLGGVFTGVGVNGNSFNTNGLQSDIYTITYTYTDPVTQCEASCNFSVNIYVGVKTNNTQSINVYPNPNSGQFSITFGDIEGKITYQVLDTKGSVILEDVTLVDNTTIKDLSLDLLPGLYYIKVISEQQTFIEKIIVQ